MSHTHSCKLIATEAAACIAGYPLQESLGMLSPMLDFPLQDLQEALDSCAWLPVAPGWTEHFAAGLQQPFYVHQATGRKQWQRPAAVESQQAVSASHAAPAAVTVALQDAASQLDRPSAQATEVCRQSTDPAVDTAQQRPARSQARSAVSCPCDASGACTAVFEIRSRTDLQTAKQARDEDVTSKLADLDIREGCMALFDSASELEMRKTGFGKDLRKRKLTSAQQLRHKMQRAKHGLRRSHSCQWIKAS